MRTLLATFTILLFSNILFGQRIITGEYSFGLKIAFDNKTNKLTGYFENYTGWDEETNNPKFSCIFYIEGLVNEDKFKINTYYPTDKSDDLIEGTIEIVDNKTIKIKLSEEHGGCWNVEHFADEPAKFELEKQSNWIQIKYIETEKAYFYKDKKNDTKQKAYLVKGDFVCVEKVEGEWVYCTYFGKNTTKGWLLIKELNKI